MGRTGLACSYGVSRDIGDQAEKFSLLSFVVEGLDRIPRKRLWLSKA